MALSYGLERGWVLSLASCAAILLGLAGGEASAGRATAQDPGRQAFLQYCASCHGTDARGAGPVAAFFRTRPSDLTRIASRNGGSFPEARIAAYIDGRDVIRAHGSSAMPVWGRRLGEQLGGDETAEEMVRGQVSVLVEYLSGIQR
jgi:mono/diheme cytochrome c family protein